MFRLIFLLFSIITYNICQSQFFDQLSSIQDKSSTKGRSGTVILDDVPIEMNIPKGFKFLDKRTSQEILIQQWDNQPLDIQEVVGMIVADNTKSIDDINEAWIISYFIVGHVEDHKSCNVEFNWLLQNLKNSNTNNGMNIEWADTPKYDPESHRMFLPFMHFSDTTSYLYYKYYIFGKTGLIQVEHSIPSSLDSQSLIDIDNSIVNNIVFKSGSRYEDFDNYTHHISYESVSNFIKGIRANYEPSAPLTPVKEPKTKSFSKISFSVIAITAIALTSLLFLLMLAVALTNKKRESSKYILQAGINVLLRIGVFCIVYLLILTFAIFLIWLGVILTIELISHYISVRIIICIIGGWIFIGTFLFAIIKSLFIVKKHKSPDRIEIYKSDSDKLFSLIEEISTASGEKMPKHVYISTEVNACVFYNKPIISLFWPARKNLEIGLGLLFGLNRQEVKAVIAHEYGHFGQKSMRIGQVTSICYNVISNLVNDDGASIVRPILKKTFLYVQRGYMALSRMMEYEADEKSALVAGNKAAISALCKIAVISNRFDAYNTLLRRIYDAKQKLPVSYWDGYKLFLTLSEYFDGFTINETIIATTPISRTPVSRVKLENPWISHPTLEQRIENLNHKSYEADSEYSLENIQELISVVIYNKSSQTLFSNSGLTSGTICDNQEYLQLLKDELSECSFPLSMRPFFNRDLSVFKTEDIFDNEPTQSIESVFSESNTLIMETYTQAISDYQTMLIFKNKETSEEEIQYDGKVYNTNTVPLDTQLKIVKDFEPTIKYIDKAVFRLALSMAHDRNIITTAYDNIFYSQAAINYIANEIIPLRDYVSSKTNGLSENISEETFKSIQSLLLDLK